MCHDRRHQPTDVVDSIHPTARVLPSSRAISKLSVSSCNQAPVYHCWISIASFLDKCGRHVDIDIDEMRSNAFDADARTDPRHPQRPHVKNNNNNDADTRSSICIRVTSSDVGGRPPPPSSLPPLPRHIICGRFEQKPNGKQLDPIDLIEKVETGGQWTLSSRQWKSV